jgi:DNA-binding CsgD family transcriptional regulator
MDNTATIDSSIAIEESEPERGQMHLHPEQHGFEVVAQIAKAFSEVLKGIGTRRFPALLSTALEQIAAYDSLIITRFCPQPVVEHVQHPIRSVVEDGEMYSGAAYLLDPFYRAAVDHGVSGFQVLSKLAPEGFTESEYHLRYYGEIGLGDECGYIVHVGSGQFLNVALNRRVERSPFPDGEVALLSAVWELVDSACKSHWKLINAQASTSGHMNQQLESALGNFGSSKLTARECEVVRLLLQGHSTQSTANKLGVSAETVKIHRRNSYLKLDINSQAELFNLFIRALQSAELYAGGDPLSGYY